MIDARIIKVYLYLCLIFELWVPSIGTLAQKPYIQANNEYKASINYALA